MDFFFLVVGIGPDYEQRKWRNTRTRGGRPLRRQYLNWEIFCAQATFADPVSFSQLWSLVPAEQRDAYLSGQKTDVAPVIDLLPLGYSKVLGKGRLPQIPVVVRARYVSRDAEEKIKAAGGVVELVA